MSDYYVYKKVQQIGQQCLMLSQCLVMEVCHCQLQNNLHFSQEEMKLNHIRPQSIQKNVRLMIVPSLLLKQDKIRDVPSLLIRLFSHEGLKANFYSFIHIRTLA
uniref:Uncharacterized protein n=1 Tax=Spongospora subterranea TaxID=70186 RepID=A0A0H5QWY4_9EUKA|eukprot:CRZ06247.1 hypothetical protein [Spongospora subterranea]